MQAVAVPSRIGLDNAAQVLADLREATRHATTGPLALDLSALREFDSSALSLLLQLARDLEGSPDGSGGPAGTEAKGAVRNGVARMPASTLPLFLLNPPEKLQELADLYGVAAMLFGPGAHPKEQARQG